MKFPRTALWRLALCLFLAFSGSFSVAEEAAPSAAQFTIGDIRVQGLQRVSPGTVFGLLPVNVGDRYDEYLARETLRSLFSSGYFSDIGVGRDGNVLVLTLLERPAIDSITLEGNESIESDALLEGLAGSGLAEGEIFQRATLERVELELTRQYVSQGRYGATIEAEVEDLPRNRVAVKITIEEGSVAKVRHLNIVGNTVYTDQELFESFEMKLPNLLSFYKNDDRYSREKLSGDLERLEAYYKDTGYVNFRIDSTQVTVNPDKSEVYITINVDEGDKYTIDDVELAGELNDVPAEALESLLLVFEGQTFSQALVTASEERLTSALGNAGYTFAEANGVPEVDEEAGTVSLRFFVDAGQRAYVRSVNFRGNTLTRDNVLRREMRQQEGGWASTSQIDLSKVRLERLGYFKNVNVETPAVPGTENQIDVEFSVEEQPSGSISGTLGYAQQAGLILGAQYQENNVFGTGNSTSVGINWSQFQQSVNFNFFDPYFTVDGISRGFNLFYRETNFGQQNVARFLTNAYGAGVNFGYPISEVERLNFGVNMDYTDITAGLFPAQEITSFIQSEGSQFLNFTANLTWINSQLNRGLFPTRGSSQNFSAEVALPGSDLLFFKVRYEGQRFIPLGSLFTLRAHTRLGYGDAFGGNSTLPFYEHFFAGGFGSVRGFELNSLGPRATEPPDSPFQGRRPQPFGGNVLITGGLEVILPVPFIEDDRQFRPVAFFDFGNVFNTQCPRTSTRCYGPSLDNMRYSLGLGVTWLSGFGPLSFGVAQVFNEDADDQTQFFQFELGRTF